MLLTEPTPFPPHTCFAFCTALSVQNVPTNRFVIDLVSNVIVQRIDLKSAMVHAYKTLLVPLAVEEPALLYAILLRTSTEFKNGGGDKPDQTVGPQTAVTREARHNAESEYVHFKIQAIRHLRRSLGGDGGFVNPAMIHAIAILLRAEVRSLNIC